MKAQLVLRADANTQIGTGHVMRCLALAQAWQDAGGCAHVAAVAMPDGLAARLDAERVQLHCLNAAPGSQADAMQTVALARELGAVWIVQDGYHFDAAYQSSIKQAGLSLLSIDDYGHAEHYVADLVLNQNIYADAALYARRASGTRLLLGTQYVLLRREFQRWQGWQGTSPAIARKVLVTLGGSDPDNVTLKLIEALDQVQVNLLEVVVVVGSSNPHMASLQQAVQRSPHALRVEQNVTDISELMAWAEVLLSAGGSTCWEIAFMGKPALILSIADNQIAVAAGLEQAHAAINIGHHATLTTEVVAKLLMDLLVSPEKRSSLAHQGRRLVDGRGASRVVDLMNNRGLRLRPVQAEDSRLIWAWANDPAARLQSFSSESIRWEQHQAWFEARMSDPLTRFYVAVDAHDRPIGQIRFQLEAESATVSVSLGPEQRGKGYGAALIRLGSQQIWSETSVMRIHAYIKQDNHASLRVFTDAEYVNAGTNIIQGNPALQYILTRP